MDVGQTRALCRDRISRGSRSPRRHSGEQRAIDTSEQKSTSCSTYISHHGSDAEEQSPRQVWRPEFSDRPPCLSPTHLSIADEPMSEEGGRPIASGLPSDAISAETRATDNRIVRPSSGPSGLFGYANTLDDGAATPMPSLRAEASPLSSPGHMYKRSAESQSPRVLNSANFKSAPPHSTVLPERNAKSPRRSRNHDHAMQKALTPRARKSPHDGQARFPVIQDSGYGTQDKYSISIPEDSHQEAPKQNLRNHKKPANKPLMEAKVNKTLRHPPPDPDVVKLLAYAHISSDHLATEIRNIYASLVMSEAQCIHIISAQNAEAQAWGTQEWKGLINLHRTLLYEHHDFLMATTHPSATETLRNLPAKYSMPARMWKHAIHAFLEVLRHALPASRDFMLAFINLAYQMIALLLETVPSFRDTWLECLGDLARYRMSIEEFGEIHDIWCGVAARWYTLVSDRYPNTGRLYHHLGILELPSLRKLCLYSKALTCVVPFSNARVSMNTLCKPIAERRPKETDNVLGEASILTLHALKYTDSDPELVQEAQDKAFQSIRAKSLRIGDVGTFLGIVNINALFEFGLPEGHQNLLFKIFEFHVSSTRVVDKSGRPTESRPAPTSALDVAFGEFLQKQATQSHDSRSLNLIIEFCFTSFNSIVAAQLDIGGKAALNSLLPYVHVTLVFLHSLHAASAQCVNKDVLTAHFGYHRLVDWDQLALLLNALVRQQGRISVRTIQQARLGQFPVPELPRDAIPLSEDYHLRGLVWCQDYFPEGWFGNPSEDDGRSIENLATFAARMNRVLWLGLCVALHSDYLEYSFEKRRFASLASSAVTKTEMDVIPESGSRWSPSKQTPKLEVKREHSPSDRPSEITGSGTMVFEEEDAP